MISSRAQDKRVAAPIALRGYLPSDTDIKHSSFNGSPKQGTKRGASIQRHRRAETDRLSLQAQRRSSQSIRSSTAFLPVSISMLSAAGTTGMYVTMASSDGDIHHLRLYQIQLLLEISLNSNRGSSEPASSLQAALYDAPEITFEVSLVLAHEAPRGTGSPRFQRSARTP